METSPEPDQPTPEPIRREDIALDFIIHQMGADKDALAAQLRAISDEARSALERLEQDGTVRFGLNALPGRIAEVMCRNARLEGAVFVIRAFRPGNGQV